MIFFNAPNVWIVRLVLALVRCRISSILELAWPRPALPSDHWRRIAWRRIKDFMATLKDRSKPVEKRLRSPPFRIHFIDDMQMPTHLGDIHDRSGNDAREKETLTEKRRNRSELPSRPTRLLKSNTGNVNDKLRVKLASRHPEQSKPPARMAATDGSRMA